MDLTFTAVILEELCRHEYADKFLISCNEDLYSWDFFTKDEATLLDYFADVQFGSINMFRAYYPEEGFSMTLNSYRNDLCLLHYHEVELTDNMPFCFRYFKIPFEGYDVHIFSTGVRVAYIVLMPRGSGEIVGQFDVLSGAKASGEMARFILRCPFWNI